MEGAVWVALIAAVASVIVALINHFSGRSERREIKRSVERNTQLTGETRQDALRTYSEANDLNRKILELGARLDNSIVVSSREMGEMRSEIRHIGEKVSELTGAAQHEKGILEGKLHSLRNTLNVLQNQSKALEIAAVRKEQLERRGASVIHTDKLEADELNIKHKDVRE